MSLTIVDFYKNVRGFTSVVVPPIFCNSFVVKRRMIMRPSQSVHRNGRSTYIMITDRQFLIVK